MGAVAASVLREIRLGIVCRVLGLITVLLAGSLAAGASEQRGDLAFLDRNDGFAETGTPNSRPTDIAIAAYESALEHDPGNLRILFKLMDALYFKGYHLVRGERLEREIYERLVDLATRAIDLAHAKAGRGDLSKLPPEQLARELRGVRDAAAAHFWGATSWGLWGTTHSKLAALGKGVASKVRNHSRVVILLDDTYGDAGGLRYLGRLYTVAPRVPFITGWADRQEGLAMLRRAVEISRRDPRNQLFLAEAILDHAPDRRGEALQLLRELSRRQPDPEHLVEHSESLERAREVLAELR